MFIPFPSPSHLQLLLRFHTMISQILKLITSLIILPSSLVIFLDRLSYSLGCLQHHCVAEGDLVYPVTLPLPLGC